MKSTTTASSFRCSQEQAICYNHVGMTWSWCLGSQHKRLNPNTCISRSSSNVISRGIIISSDQAKLSWLKHARKRKRKNSGKKSTFLPDHLTKRFKHWSRTLSLPSQLQWSVGPSWELTWLAEPYHRLRSGKFTRCTLICSTRSKRLDSFCTVQSQRLSRHSNVLCNQAAILSTGGALTAETMGAARSYHGLAGTC